MTMPRQRFERAKPGGCGLGPLIPALWQPMQVFSVWQLAQARMLRWAWNAW